VLVTLEPGVEYEVPLPVPWTGERLVQARTQAIPSEPVEPSEAAAVSGDLRSRVADWGDQFGQRMAGAVRAWDELAERAGGPRRAEVSVVAAHWHLLQARTTAPMRRMRTGRGR